MDKKQSSHVPENEVPDWHQKIAIANQNNIFCHCRQCDREWVDSTWTENCICGSHNIERISCWQFPDG